jgi:CheY-like chemotaxis protein
MGLKVSACSNSASALALMDKTIDFVIVEHVMEHENGLTFAKTAREAGHGQKMVLLTHNNGQIKTDPLSDCVDIIAQRPFTRNDLIDWLQIEDDKVHNPELTEDMTGAEEEPAPRKMRVLAAEDNKTNRLVFGKMIKALDIELQFACDGQEAVEAYSTFQPDLIFMDISMPRLDGKEATKAIRAIEAETGVHVPILALTAHAMSGDDHEILKAGLDKYLTKPLRKKEIVGQILEFCPPEAVAPCPPDILDQTG